MESIKPPPRRYQSEPVPELQRLWRLYWQMLGVATFGLLIQLVVVFGAATTMTINVAVALGVGAATFVFCISLVERLIELRRERLVRQAKRNHP